MRDVSKVTSEDVVERMFACQHRMVVQMREMAGFEEWSPLEVLAMRVFARNEMALGATDLERILGCPHASRLVKSLKARGLVAEHRWKNYRSLMKTEAGLAWLEREQPYLTAFANQLLGPLSTTERRGLFIYLGRVMRIDDGS